LGFLLGVTYEDFVPLWLVTLPPKSPLNRTRFGGFSSCSSSSPREPISSIPLDCAIRVDSFEVEVAQEITQLFLKFHYNLWSDSGDRAMGS
jgi:hypothetical protein